MQKQEKFISLKKDNKVLEIDMQVNSNYKISKSMLKNGNWITDNYTYLSSKYGGNYIAVANKKVVAFDPRYNVVESKGKSISKDCMIAYIEKGDEFFAVQTIL